MKVLCLHGKGTSGAIFRSQTSSFRAKLADQDIEFDFLDGPYEGSAAAGVDLFYDPPYFSWWQHDGSVEEVRAAVAELNEYIAENGPYDAAMMFSQGCVLGSAALLLHQEETPHLPAPFKTAIFICGGPSMSILEELGFHVSAKARERDVASRNALTQQANNSAILTQGANRWTGESLSEGLSEQQLQNEIECPFRIAIPTVHIYGSKDPRYAAGVHLSAICLPERRRTYNHEGGHEIPRNSRVSDTIAGLVRWALAEEPTAG